MPKQKEIVLKTIIYIDGIPTITKSCDYSENISEYEKECDYELAKSDIIDYILASENEGG